ncbi:MAG: hypothetical protein EON61_01070 [Alphaproteobacteria bacterium]|jgi:hypothetical protein|nr:MAG: hypothetical protein EON61_01070 [Alphaproteobacteria bacterium]
MTKYIAKSSNDVLSHCTCEGEIAAGPAQLDCPWCGCGWLISCMECRKAFTFARVIDIDRTYEDIVREDFSRRDVEASEDDIQESAEWMAEAFADLTVGDIVVYLDGAYLSVDTTNFTYDGWFAQHDFDRLPHAVALEQPNALNETLGDKEYWLERELVDEEP